MSLFKKLPNADAVAIKLIRRLSVNIDDTEVISELERHPDYPSLLAISDILTYFKIENSAVRIGFDQLSNIVGPFIAHANVNRGEFIVVDKIEKDYVVVSNEKWNRRKLDSSEFKSHYGGVVLTAKTSSHTVKTTGIISKLYQINEPAIGVGIFLIFASALIFNTNYFTRLDWNAAILTVIKTAGLFTAILLLIESIDTDNPLIQKFCKNGSKKNCNAVLSSSAAKIFKNLSWSDVGFFYFSGTWLLLLFGGGSKVVWQLLAVLNFISLPYTFYSIYFQARIAKQWCTLCCTVQALLWIEFVTFITSPFTLPFIIPDLKEFSVLFICLSSPVFFWKTFKPLFLKLHQLNPLKQQLRKLKYNTELFNKLLSERPRYAIPDEEWSIVLGNNKANNIITMVTNPYCPPCTKAHKLLDELLTHRDDIQARIVFTANNSENDIKTPVSRHLMALNELKDKTNVKNALNDWYDQKQKNYETWAKAYPVSQSESDYNKIDKQNAWCKMADIKATPTMLINGYPLPDFYQLPDLRYMLN